MTAKKKKTVADWMPQVQPLSNKAAKAFLYALMRMGNVSKAAKHARANRTALYQRKARDPEFAQAWAECLKVGVSALEDHAFERAAHGWDEPVFHDGEECGVKRKFSPALTIFLLKAHDPKYRDRLDLQQSGPGGAPLSLQIVMDPRALAEVEQ